MRDRRIPGFSSFGLDWVIMKIKTFFRNRDRILVIVFLCLTAMLYWLPTGYEKNIDAKATHSRRLVMEVDNSEVQQLGIVKVGTQALTLKLLDGPHKGQTVEGINQLLGKLEMDKMFAPGDTALVVLTQNPQGEIVYANPQDHYRLNVEILLFCCLGVCCWHSVD